MRIPLCLFVGLCFIVTYSIGQDEGLILKKDRLDRSNSIYVDFGPSYTLGDNVEDYGVGVNIGLGYTKRMNRVLSVGASITHLTFEFNSDVRENTIFIGGPYYNPNINADFYEALVFQPKGGNINLTSLGATLKFNLIPVRNDSKISVYAMARPFGSYVHREEISASGLYIQNYGDPSSDLDWENAYREAFEWRAGDEDILAQYGYEVSGDLKKNSTFTGGIFVGGGIEIFPAKVISGFLQVSAGYTAPISYINTSYYNIDNNLEKLLEKGIETYPVIKKGFTSVNVQLGVAFNF
jgi:hypothetical protein